MKELQAYWEYVKRNEKYIAPFIDDFIDILGHYAFTVDPKLTDEMIMKASPDQQTMILANINKGQKKAAKEAVDAQESLRRIGKLVAILAEMLPWVVV